MQNQIIKKILLSTVILLVISGLLACNTPTNSTETNQTSVASTSGGEIVQSQTDEAINAEKEKLQKEREKLEKEKQELKDEKAKAEKLKGATPPEAKMVGIGTTSSEPPVNIRDSPNGKILCTVKKAATAIKIYGSSDIQDNNGEWYYTNHCGKMGVIHSTQFVMPG